jgi:phytoene dehydrogenase-like protein
MARTASGAEIEARCAVLAATAASNLYGELVSWDHLPARLRDDMRRFQWDYSTFKVDWALRQPVPWLAPEVAGAGTVHVATTPGQFEASDANLVGGALNGGTTAVQQQLVFRPTPGLGRPETPIADLYLASSSAQPGGGVHGACGANAARAALRPRRAHLQHAAAAGARLAIGC